MKDLMFFDANCSLGKNEHGQGVHKDELLKDMDYFGVDKALVRSFMKFQNAVYTNDYIAKAVRGEERLVGVWCILPDQCDEVPKPDDFFAQMKENNIGAITLLPELHRFLPNRLTIGRIMDAAAERRVPVLLDGFKGKWKEMYEFIATFPNNVFLSMSASGKWGTDRNIRPLLENYPNFYFELMGYWVPEGIYDLAEKYGADRIIYGSGFPTMDQGSPMLQLKQSRLDDEAIAKIAGGNLENILKGAQL